MLQKDSRYWINAVCSPHWHSAGLNPIKLGHLVGLLRGYEVSVGEICLNVAY